MAPEYTENQHNTAILFVKTMGYWHGIQEAVGSIPSSSTNNIKHLWVTTVSAFSFGGSFVPLLCHFLKRSKREHIGR
jgi:hypothetical protein